LPPATKIPLPRIAGALGAAGSGSGSSSVGGAVVARRPRVVAGRRTGPAPAAGVGTVPAVTGSLPRPATAVIPDDPAPGRDVRVARPVGLSPVARLPATEAADAAVAGVAASRTISAEAVLAGVAVASTLSGAKGASRDPKARPQFEQLLGQPMERLPQTGHRPGGASTSRSEAIGPRNTPNTNQTAHGRARWSASQLARGANRIAETITSKIGTESPGTLPPRQPTGLRRGNVRWRRWDTPADRPMIAIRRRFGANPVERCPQAPLIIGRSTSCDGFVIDVARLASYCGPASAQDFRAI